jgi:hypothetical protein
MVPGMASGVVVRFTWFKRQDDVSSMFSMKDGSSPFNNICDSRVIAAQST